MPEFECPDPRCKVRQFGSASGCMVCSEFYPRLVALQEENKLLKENAEPINVVGSLSLMFKSGLLEESLYALVQGDDGTTTWRKVRDLSCEDEAWCRAEEDASQ